MKKIKKLFYMLALLLLIGGASLGLSEKTVEASSGVIALRNNRVYRTYDLDGNRRKDSIMLKTTGKRYNLSASFYVNESIFFTKEGLLLCEIPNDNFKKWETFYLRVDRGGKSAGIFTQAVTIF